MSNIGKKYKKFGAITPELHEEIKSFYRQTGCSLKEASVRFNLSPSKLSTLYGTGLQRLDDKPQIVLNHPTEINIEEIFLQPQNGIFFLGLCKGLAYPSDNFKKEFPIQNKH